ncbi:MAG: hypothetical protein AAFU78_22895, partial [Cyanobacteria bacterium J06633_2]
FWMPVSSFAGIIVPFKGNIFVNNGFSSEDWDIQSGLQGDGVSTLRTGILVPDVSTFDNTSYGFYVGAFDPANRTGVRGGGANATCTATTNGVRIGSNSAGELNFTVGASDQANTFYSGTRFSTSLIKAYVNGVIDATDTATYSASDTSGGGNEFDVMAYELNGSVAPISSENSASFLAVPALTDAEMLSLSQMIAAIEAGRPGLSSPVDALLNVAQANGATHMWDSRAGFSVTGTPGVDDVSTWTDQIASVDLISPPDTGLTSIEENSISVLQAGAKDYAVNLTTPTHSVPLQLLVLVKPGDSTNNFRTIIGAGSDRLHKNLAASASDNWRLFDGGGADSSISTASTANIWTVFYAEYDTTAYSLKIGANALEALSPGTLSSSAGFSVFGRSDGSARHFGSIAFLIANTSGDWSNENINAIATQAVTEFSALSPQWSAIS